MMDRMLTGRVYDAAEGHAIGLSQYLVGKGEGMAKAMELAAKIAGNAPMTNFAVMHALPRIAETSPESGYMMEAMISSIAPAEIEEKNRIRDFIEKYAAKVGKAAPQAGPAPQTRGHQRKIRKTSGHEKGGR